MSHKNHGPSRIIILGAPGSGKGTQGVKLAGVLNSAHVATGDLIREEAASGSERGSRFRKLIDDGNFISDSDVVTIVEKRLAQPDAKRGYVLDGFPRTMDQATLFAKTEPGRRLDIVALLSVSEPVLVERLSGRLICSQCGQTYHKQFKPPRRVGLCDRDGNELTLRADDEPEAVRRRLSIYRVRTEPLIAYYERQQKLVTVEAAGTPDEVFERLLHLLGLDRTQIVNAKV